MSKIGTVMTSSPTAINVMIDGLSSFESIKEHLRIGNILKISEGNVDFVLASITSVEATRDPAQTDSEASWKFSLTCQPIGSLRDGTHFQRGTSALPVPTEPVYLLETKLLEAIFNPGGEFAFSIGRLALNRDTAYRVSGDRLFSKHLAIVGSTGSGKSCAVAKIMQEAVGISDGSNLNRTQQRNAHIVIFDLHDEYRSAFRLHENEGFTLNLLDVHNLKLPYWLMNDEELEALFIESNEANSHNQVSQFKRAVLLNKQFHNPDLGEVTYSTPCYFSLREVCNFIENLNREVISRMEGENSPKLADGRLVKNKCPDYFERVHEFVATSQSKDSKATNGPFYGEFNRFVSRLESKLEDRRLDFLLDPRKPDSTEIRTSDFSYIVKQFIGYLDRANISILDLSGIPFEVLSITVSIVTRLIFDFCFHYSKMRHDESLLNDVPVMLVCEEAHNYVPKSEASLYRASRRSIERVAKEGRKYGLGLTVVSQRPSEVSDTIMSQCNNFIVLRLTNKTDQEYIRRLLPENTGAVADILPGLATGECVIVGDATLLPAAVILPRPCPEPQSHSVRFHQEWLQEWRDVDFEQVVERWHRKSRG